MILAADWEEAMLKREVVKGLQNEREIERYADKIISAMYLSNVPKEEKTKDQGKMWSPKSAVHMSQKFLGYSYFASLLLRQVDAKIITHFQISFALLLSLLSHFMILFFADI